MTPGSLQLSPDRASVTPSGRTRHQELLRLCARIGYSPPLFA